MLNKIRENRDLYMSAMARERRIQAAKLADALNAVEGVPVSDYAQTLSACWARGELAGEQIKMALPASQKKLAEGKIST